METKNKLLALGVVTMLVILSAAGIALANQNTATSDVNSDVFLNDTNITNSSTITDDQMFVGMYTDVPSWAYCANSVLTGLKFVADVDGTVVTYEITNVEGRNRSADMMGLHEPYCNKIATLEMKKYIGSETLMGSYQVYIPTSICGQYAIVNNIIDQMEERLNATIE